MAQWHKVHRSNRFSSFIRNACHFKMLSNLSTWAKLYIFALSSIYTHRQRGDAVQLNVVMSRNAWRTTRGLSRQQNTSPQQWQDTWCSPSNHVVGKTKSACSVLYVTNITRAAVWHIRSRVLWCTVIQIQSLRAHKTTHQGTASLNQKWLTIQLHVVYAEMYATPYTETKNMLYSVHSVCRPNISRQYTKHTCTWHRLSLNDLASPIIFLLWTEDRIPCRHGL